MSTAVAVACVCGSIGASGIRLCPEHHKYYLGDKELASVSRVIRETWPIKKSFEYADPVVLEHARERGVRIDHYAAEYVKTGKVRILAGEWREVVERVQMFAEWWRRRETKAATQVIFHDDEVAGTADFLTTNGDIWDLKCVSAIDPTYFLQLGAYADLCEKQHGTAGNLAFIHLPKEGPRFIAADLQQCRDDWRTLRQMYLMVKRRSK